MLMSAHSLLLLDSSSSLADTLRNISNALFQVPVIITALVLTFVCALIAWIIAYVFLRPKEVCSMVCSIHFLLTIATIVLGLLGALGLIDHYFPGSLITGASVSLLVLAIPLFILVESFNYVVLSNKHARRHRDLRTPQDRNTRRGVVFLAPLALGVILLAVGIIVGTAVSTIAQVIAHANLPEAQRGKAGQAAPDRNPSGSFRWLPTHRKCSRALVIRNEGTLTLLFDGHRRSSFLPHTRIEHNIQQIGQEIGNQHNQGN